MFPLHIFNICMNQIHEVILDISYKVPNNFRLGHHPRNVCLCLDLSCNYRVIPDTKKCMGINTTLFISGGYFIRGYGIPPPPTTFQVEKIGANAHTQGLLRKWITYSGVGLGRFDLIVQQSGYAVPEQFPIPITYIFNM